MTINWGGYEPYSPLVSRPHNELSRSEAKAEYENLMASRSERRDELEDLLRANGQQLMADEQGLAALNDWFIANVEGSSANAGGPSSWWFAVINDLALFLGDVIIERAPNLRWELFTGGKRDIAYQRPVIMGFSKMKNSKYNLDIDRLLVTWAYQAIQRDEPKSNMQSVVASAVSNA